MDKEYFFNAGNPPSLQPFNSSPIPNWQLHCSPEQSSDCFLNPNYESSLSSIVSSPVTSNPAVSKDSFAIRELIKKLGTICNSGEILPESHPFLAAKAAYIGGGNNNNSSNNYSTPFNSPPKLNFPIMDHQFVKENLPNLGISVPLNPNLPALSTDPGFAERAARFSCFGSRSFNDRTTQLGLNNTELSHRSSPLMTSVKLPRVSSSPSLKSQENKNCRQTHMEMSSKNGSDTKLSTVSESNAWNRTEFGSSNEESSVSEQIPNRDSNSRKRKGFPRGKSKDSVNPPKVVEAEDDPNSKRSKSNEGNGSENGRVKTEKETKGTRNGAGDEAKTKPPEPPKDYIHVRARRGQATDSHSLAERVRREKISERMKLLQDLVPGCNKVTGKALMLDEIINYVQSLQRQVEFLSMKLASVNPRLDFDMDSLLSKDVFQPNVSLPHPTYPLDSSSSAFFGHQTPQVHTNLSKGAVNPIDTTLCPNIGFQLPQVDEFGQALPQFPPLCEDDLQSFVEMGFVQNPNRETGFHSENFPGSSQTSSHMKIEL